MLPAIEAITSLDDEHAKLYYDLIVARLSDAQRTELEAMMLGGKKYEYQSEIARRLVEQGRQERLERGRKELQGALLEILEARGLLTDEARTRIAAEQELGQLRIWLRRAATVSTIDEVLSA